MSSETEAEKGAAATFDENLQATPEEKLSEVNSEYLQEVKAGREKISIVEDFDELAPEPGGPADNIIGPETKGTTPTVSENSPYAVTPLSEEGIGETSPTGTNLSP